MSKVLTVRQVPEVAQGLAELIAGYLQEYLEESRRQISDLAARVDNIERRLAAEGLTRSQGRAIQRAVGQKAHEAARNDGSSVHQHYANIYGGLKDKYNVPSYLDIPRDKFQEALRLISQYDGSSRDWWRE